ncbi:hypothetical protein Hanom_Chr14g01330061 [Helianthus anomalus]
MLMGSALKRLSSKHDFFNVHLVELKRENAISSLRFGEFCNFRPKVCFSHLDPKGLKSYHFHPAC